MFDNNENIPYPGYVLFEDRLCKLPKDLIKTRRSFNPHYSNIIGVNTYPYRVFIPKEYLKEFKNSLPSKYKSKFKVTNSFICKLYKRWYKTLIQLDELGVSMVDSLYDFNLYRTYHINNRIYKKGEISYLAYYMLYKPKEIGVENFIQIDKDKKIVNLINEIKRLNSTHDEDKINRAIEAKRDRVFISFFGKEKSYTYKKGLHNQYKNVVRLKYYLLKRRLIKEYEPTTKSMEKVKEYFLTHYDNIIKSIVKE